MGFFNLSKALEEVSDAFGAKETAIASAKLLGKGVVNLAHFAATTGLDSVVKQTSNKVLNSESSTEEQREQAKKSAAWADARIAARNKAENTEDQLNAHFDNDVDYIVDHNFKVRQHPQKPTNNKELACLIQISKIALSMMTGLNLVVEMKITVTTMKNGIEELNDNSRR